jgi:cyclic pyranopterin phosphate synthase
MNNNLSEIFGQNKIFKHLDKLRKYEDGELETLITAKIDMTNKCSSHCPLCVGGRKSQSSLSREDAFYVIKQLSNFGVRALVFSGGGEPLMNPYTVDSALKNKGLSLKIGAIEYAVKREMDVGLITNGIQLTKQKSEVLLDNCSWIRVSFDAGTPEMYYKVHRDKKEIFDKVIKNTTNLVNIRNKIGSECTIGTAYLTGKNTLDGMLDFVKLSKKVGVDYTQFRPFHNDYVSIDNELETCKLLETDNFKVLHSEQKYLRFNDEDKRTYKKCLGMNFITIIDADMNVLTCCHSRGHKENVLGNLRKNTLWEIWENRKNNPNWEKITNNCPYFCEEDTLNRVLDNITKYQKHENFL